MMLIVWMRMLELQRAVETRRVAIGAAQAHQLLVRIPAIVLCVCGTDDRGCGYLDPGIYSIYMNQGHTNNNKLIIL